MDRTFDLASDPRDLTLPFRPATKLSPFSKNSATAEITRASPRSPEIQSSTTPERSLRAHERSSSFADKRLLSTRSFRYSDNYYTTERYGEYANAHHPDLAYPYSSRTSPPRSLVRRHRPFRSVDFSSASLSTMSRARYPPSDYNRNPIVMKKQILCMKAFYPTRRAIADT